MPTMASASPELQSSAGVKVGTGTGITAVQNSDSVLTTSSGNITCTSNHMSGELVTNSGKLIEGTIKSASFTGAGTSGRCKSTINVLGSEVQFQVTTENLHWCLSSSALGTWSLRGGACTAAPSNLKFTLHGFFPGGGSAGSCTYERASVTGTNNTLTSPLILTTGANQTFTRVSGTICPSAGTLDASFKVTTSTGGELKVV